MTSRAATCGAPSSLAGVAARIDAIRGWPDAAGTLVGLLAEQSPVYAGRGSNEAERIRGYILASFETAGLPGEAMPYVLEELESGDNPYTVAGAARALRSATSIPAEAPRLLVGALARLQGTDDIVAFERLEPLPAADNVVTALAELARTLTLLGPRARPALQDLQALLSTESAGFSTAVLVELRRAEQSLARAGGAKSSCCGAGSDKTQFAVRMRVASSGGSRVDLHDLVLEDQDGASLTFSEAFSGRPSALAFFYTRCMNPQKCSLTVTRLGLLARRLSSGAFDANVAGISYDPDFDHPARLKTYGNDRGIIFSPRCRLLRARGSFEPLRRAFDLGVGFGLVTVNRHRVELLVLDPSLHVRQSFERRLWHEEKVLDALRDAAQPVPS